MNLRFALEMVINETKIFLVINDFFLWVKNDHQ